MRDDDLRKIRDRLEALRRMTVDNGCSEAEALLAAEKMAELLARYGLTEEQLEALGYDQAEVGLGARRNPLEKVWMAVASFSDCIAWLSRRPGRLGIVYFGRPQDVLVAQYVHDVLQRAYEGDVARFKASGQYQRRRLPRTRAQALKAFTNGWAEEVSANVYMGLWRRNGGTMEQTVARIKDRRRALEAAAAEVGGVRMKSCRALSSPKATTTKGDRLAGVLAGGRVEVNAGVGAAGGAGQVAGLLTAGR